MRLDLPIMSGRRSHARFSMLPSPEGVFRVLRDVVVRGAMDEHLVVVSRQPGVRGELLSLHSPDDSESTVVAEVLESHPVIVDGAVRYQLRLQPTNPPDGGRYEKGPAGPSRVVYDEGAFEE